MSLISTRCLVVLVLILLPFRTRSDGTPGFPELRDNKTIKAALEKIRAEDSFDFKHETFGNVQPQPIYTVEALLPCFEGKEELCFANELVKNEVRLRNGYKLLDEGCSSDPGLNQILFNPPKYDDLMAYPKWQRVLLDANLPLCSPFKHLQCSKTTAKCECRPGLLWREEPFHLHEIYLGDLHTSTPVVAVREREKICVFDLNKPCQMREYPGDVLIDSKSLSPKQIADGMPIAEYFSIFLRGGGGSGFQSNKIEPPSCGDNECSRSFYTQRRRACATRKWDKRVFDLEKHFSVDNSILMPIGSKCDYEHHHRLYTFSKEELSGPVVRARRRKKLEEIKESQSKESPGKNRVCDLMSLMTCSPNSELCECIHPFMPTKASPSSCVLAEEHNKCDMTNGIIKLLRNETYARATKFLLNKGVKKFMVGACPGNLQCHVGLDIDDEMEMYCTCRFGTGPQCNDKLTGFLMQPRVPSFPSDGKNIDEKWKIFNEFNEKAIKFEEIFKLSEGKSCDLKVEAEASTAVEKIRRLDKKGTVMTKGQYKDLTDAIVKLTGQHQNGQGLCQRLDPHPHPLTCNSVSKTCVKADENIMLEACRHLADTCELEGMIILGGRCVCDPKFQRERSTSPLEENSTSSINSTIVRTSLGVLNTPPDFFIAVGIIISVICVINSNY